MIGSAVVSAISTLRYETMMIQAARESMSPEEYSAWLDGRQRAHAAERANSGQSEKDCSYSTAGAFILGLILGG